MIFPARLLYSVLNFPRKFKKHVISILIKFSIKNDRCYIEIMTLIAARLL